MFRMMAATNTMRAAASAEAVFSCANNTALILDAALLASILFAVLGLRLCTLLNLLVLRMKDLPIFA